MSVSNTVLTNEVFTWVSRQKIPNPVSVTLSEKQCVGNEWIDDQKSSQNLRHFLNRLNQKVYGKRFRRYNKRLSVFPVQEGTKDVRHHIHLTMELPDNYDINTFNQLVCECWSKTRFGYNQVQVVPMRDDGWVRYQLKMRSKSTDVLSSIDWNNVHFSTSTE